MTNFVISHNESREILQSADDILLRIEQIGEQYRALHGIPYGIDLLKDNGRIEDDPSFVERISVGVGNGEWMLFYYPGDGSCLNSLGDENATGTATFYFGDWSKVSRKYLVPKDLALKTIRNWIVTGNLGNAISWTDKLY